MSSIVCPRSVGILKYVFYEIQGVECLVCWIKPQDNPIN